MRSAALGEAVDRRRAGGGVADVDLLRRDFASRGARGAHDLVCSHGIVAIEERHVGAVLGEELYDRAADAARLPPVTSTILSASPASILRILRQPEMQNPPSTTSVCPVIIFASGRQSRYTAPATSSGVSVGPAGVRCAKLASSSSRFGK